MTATTPSIPRKPSEMGRHDDSHDDESSSLLDDDNGREDRHERKRSLKKHNKRKREDRSSKKKKKQRRREQDSSESDSSSSRSTSTRSADGDKRGKHKKKRRKSKDERKDRAKDKKSRKRHDRHETRKKSKRRNDLDSEDDNNNNEAVFGRNHALANALCQLLDAHPALISDLPIMLIRLAGGTTFDLSQMTDVTAAQGIAAVFGCLESYGVQQEATTGVWMWKGPQQQQQQGGNRSNNNKNDLVLVRVVRTLLDQIGVTNEAVEAFEKEELKRKQAILKGPPPMPDTSSQKVPAASSSSPSRKEDPIIGQVKQMFAKNEGLGKELAVLCNMILEGESVALDGLPDDSLRKALESLFETCGLEKFEMENDNDSDEEQDDDDDDNQEETPSMGYGLPENDNDSAKGTTARVRLESILTACQQQTQTASSTTAEQPAGRRVLGPSLPPPAGGEEEEESDEEGPQLTDRALSARPEAADAVRAQAARRARELRMVNAGLSAKDAAAMDDAGGREEWMIVPGQYDFLDCIKSAPMRNRKFQGGSKHDKDKQAADSGPIDPAVQAEMDAILQAHQDSRGPSLMEEHRAAKAAAEAEKKKGKKNNWKWNRDRDLDEGRRVDKDALNMVMGGAASGLQSKFQGGFNSSR